MERASRTEFSQWPCGRKSSSNWLSPRGRRVKPAASAPKVPKPVGGCRIQSPAAIAGPCMEAIVERDNLRKALAQVRRNKGAAGVDGMSVEALSAHLKDHWPTIRRDGERGAVADPPGAVSAPSPPTPPCVRVRTRSRPRRSASSSGSAYGRRGARRRIAPQAIADRTRREATIPDRDDGRCSCGGNPLRSAT